MYTLQILDRGQTFLHPVDDRPLRLGSDPAADVVLGEQGVAAEHVRLEPGPDGVLLTACAPTLVNGRPQTTCRLALGDRIEIGRAVVVVGRTVPRPAGPDDVLADDLRRARERRREPAARRSWLLPALAAAAMAGIVGWLASGGSSARVGEELAAIQRWRDSGQLERAAASIARLEVEWAGAPDDRLQRLAAERAAIAGIEAEQARLIEAVLDPADERGYAAWSQELQRLEHEGEPAQRIAARAVRSDLTATLRRRPPAARDLVAGGATTTPVAPTPAPGRPATPAPAVSPAPAAADPVTPLPSAVTPTARIDLAAIDPLCAQGLFAQAINLLQSARAEEDPAGVVRLEARIAAVHEQARRAAAALLEEAERSFAAGDLRDGLQLLRVGRHRFPPTADYAALDRAIAAGEARLASPASSLAPAAAAGVAVATPRTADVDRVGTLSAVRAQLDAVRTAEEQGAFAQAAGGLRAAAAAVRDRDADFARRLEARADEAALLAAWHDAVAAALLGGRSLSTVTRDGQAVTLGGVDGPRLVAGAVRLSWYELAAAGVQSMAEQLGAAGPAALGAATLLYRCGEPAAAEALLARLLRADPAAKPGVDGVLARGRGESPDAGGYTLGKDGFVAVRTLELQQQAARLGARLEAALRDPAARQALVDETLAGEPAAVQVLAAALRRELAKQVQRLDSGSLRKQVERVARQREVVDAARTAARDLIYDEQRYFYPYKPPAVSSDRYAEYVRVQAEVDRRVAALRTAWNDDKARIRPPTSLRGDLERLDWTAAALERLGELDHGMLARIEWVRALPPLDSIGVKEWCMTLAERAEHDEWRRVEAFNAEVGKQLSSGQRELLRITNGYRAMFRHRPLAIVPVVCVAAQGHAEEMGRLGYFAHTSPTPERRTPYDRMRLAGYPFGVSENIALVDGALGAHNAWCTSSGHHRNLLDPNHREIGIGVDGRHWVQNFGSGTAHREHAVWAVVAGKER